MPGGPLLGIDWHWLAGRVGNQHFNGVSQRPPRVVLLTPAGQDAYNVPVHRSAEVSGEVGEPTNDVQEPRAVATKASVPDHALYLGLKLAACAALVWLLWLRVVPTSASLCALLWSLYVYGLNAASSSRVRAATPVFEDGKLSRSLASWCAVVLIFGMLLPVALALACPIVLGSSGRAVLEITSPSIFLLAAQLLMDSTIADTPNLWSDMVASLNHCGFTVLRIVWCYRCAAGMLTLSHTAAGATTRLERGFLHANAALAVVDAVLWSTNLFAYLLPKLCNI